MDDRQPDPWAPPHNVPASSMPGTPPPPPFGGPAFGDGWPAPPPPKRRRTKRILLITGAVVGGLFVAFIALGVALVLTDHSHAKKAAAHTTLVTPTSIAGMDRMDDAELRGMADQTVANMRTDNEIRDPVAAFYADSDGLRPRVFLWGGIAVVDDPEQTMHDVIKGVQEDGFDVPTFSEFPPGLLGGEFRCGETTLDGTRTSLCVWADQGSVAAVAVYREGVETAAGLARQVREAVEHRTS